ncbi:MAG: alpha-glucan family phosphorylase [Acidobacteriota bacterium]|nr:MAG: alpha-glucan family phosphorylase [Acidobacteriota bacterium]
MAGRSIAFFSMEVALDPGMPTYSSGLGVRAGDAIRAAADLELPLVAVTLLHRRGSSLQRLDEADQPDDELVEEHGSSFAELAGDRSREPTVPPLDEQFFQQMPARCRVRIENRDVQIRAFKHDVSGASGQTVSVLFLDADLPDNDPRDRALTDPFHRSEDGSERDRLCQQVLLGIGGVRMLEALGYDVERYHLHEADAALLTLELLDHEAREAGRVSFNNDDIEAVRAQCLLTLHAAGTSQPDSYPLDLVGRVFEHRASDFVDMRDVFTVGALQQAIASIGSSAAILEPAPAADELNMMLLALRLSRSVNGVDLTQRPRSQARLLSDESVAAIPGGVHAASWVSEPFAELFDHHMPGWREDSSSLRAAVAIPRRHIWKSHVRAKRALARRVSRAHAVELNTAVLTLGFAQRLTGAASLDLLLADVERLKQISAEIGALQIVCCDAAQPRDRQGTQLIERIERVRAALEPDVSLVYLGPYGITMTRAVTAGVDVWVDVPAPRGEAAGQGGIKAALNGVPSLGALEGWWAKGHVECVTGWAIAEPSGRLHNTKAGRSAAPLFDKLEQAIVPLYYQDRDGFIDVMRHAIALNGSFFTAQRMLRQYASRVYFV